MAYLAQQAYDTPSGSRTPDFSAPQATTSTDPMINGSPMPRRRTPTAIPAPATLVQEPRSPWPPTRKTLRLIVAFAMLEEMPTTADLLTAWRDATRAADLARRLAEVAEQTAASAVADSGAAAEVASLAESAAKAATEAAAKARATADPMKRAADTAQGKGRDDAASAVTRTGEEEATARDRYHAAEAEARRRQGDAKP